MPGDLRERERGEEEWDTEAQNCMCVCVRVCLSVCVRARESVRVSSRGAVLNPCSIVTAHMTEDTKLSIKHTNVVCERILPAFFNMLNTILTKKIKVLTKTHLKETMISIFSKKNEIPNIFRIFE